MLVKFRYTGASGQNTVIYQFSEGFDGVVISAFLGVLVATLPPPRPNSGVHRNSIYIRQSYAVQPISWLRTVTAAQYSAHRFQRML